jgi:VWFA-related protein
VNVRTNERGILIAAACSLLVAVVSAQDLPVFRSSVELVPISAVVRDGKNRLVTTLTAADFEVLDKGTPQRIVEFQRESAGPLTVALLVDVSGSMRVGPKMVVAAQVIESLKARLDSGKDEAALFTFDSALHAGTPFTGLLSTIRLPAAAMQPFGTTSLYDAIAETARRVAARPPQRRAVVVFTDGVDTSSTLTAPEVSGLASSIDVPVYVVVTVPAIDGRQYVARQEGGPVAGADLRDLAQWTGGDLLVATGRDHADQSAAAIVNELRHQYLIAIESSDRREWRPLSVRVRDQRLTVRARSGYFGREATVR